MRSIGRNGVLEQVVRTRDAFRDLPRKPDPEVHGHLFGNAGKKGLVGLPLPDEEKAIVGRLVDELQRNSDQLTKLDMTIIRKALEDQQPIDCKGKPALKKCLGTEGPLGTGAVSQIGRSPISLGLAHAREGARQSRSSDHCIRGSS